MIKNASVINNTLLDKILFFKEVELKRLTLLFGGNGAGKSSFLKGLTPDAKHKDQGFVLKVSFDPDTRFVHYSNARCNYLNRDLGEYRDNMFLLAAITNKKFKAREMSEGESSIYSVEDFKYMVETQLEGEYLVAIDEIDTGLDPINVREFCEWLKATMKKKPKLQFVIAFNNYEFVRAFADQEVFLNMYTGRYEKLEDDYEEYISYLGSLKYNFKRKHFEEALEEAKN